MCAARRAVTFLLSPTSALSWYPQASRLLCSALQNDPQLEVSIPDVTAELFIDSLRQARRQARRRALTTTLDLYLTNLLRVTPHLDVVAGHYDPALLAAAATEDVFLSALSVYDLYVAACLLNAGRRVVLGGNLTLLYSAARLRQLLTQLNVLPQVLQQRLCILSGYITPEMRLAPLLQQFQDLRLPTPTVTCLTTPKHDWLGRWQGALSTLLPQISIAVQLRAGCWFGQCQFCTVRAQGTVDLRVGIATHTLEQHLRELAAFYGTTRIVITDNDLELDAQTIAVLSSRAPQHVTAYASVRRLLDPDYVRTLSNCVDGLRIGIESGSDAALAACGKQISVADIERALGHVIKYVAPTTELSLLVIYDLPHPCADAVRSGFAKLVELKARLTQAGFSKVRVDGYPLWPFPDTAMVADHPQLRVVSRGTCDPSLMNGAALLHLEYERRSGRPLPASLAALIPPLKRLDAYGKPMPSDLYLVEADTLKQLENVDGSDPRPTAPND